MSVTLISRLLRSRYRNDLDERDDLDGVILEHTSTIRATFQMKANTVIALMALATIWPIASHAGGIDIPEIGVHIGINIVQQEDNSPVIPQITYRFDGIEAALPLGIATLTIARLKDPVAANSDIRDDSFRATQQAEFYDESDPSAHEEATTLAGHDAWMITTVRSGGPHTVNYRSTAYTIVDQHLYRIVARATGDEKSPSDYQAAIHLLSAIRFVPMDQSSPPNTAMPIGLLKMPRLQQSRHMEWYPPQARRRHEEGVVDLEYSIDGKGQVRGTQATFSTSRTLQDAAQAFLTGATFKVRPTWEDDGYQKLRFATEVQFWLGRCPRNFPARTPGAEVVTICASGIPR